MNAGSDTISVGHLVIAEAGPNALATFDLSRDGTVSLLDQAATGQAATCWVTLAGPLSAGGQLGLLGNTVTDPGAVDAAAAARGRLALSWR